VPDHEDLEIKEFWVAIEVYPREFKADAVALYLSDPARTSASVATRSGAEMRIGARL
jgi:transposase-like protein